MVVSRERMHRTLAVVVVVACLTTARAATTLKLLGQASLPTGGAKGPGTEQVAFDDQQKVAYLIGDSQLYIIDLSPGALLTNGEPADTPKPLSVLQTVNFPTTINDVSFCGGYLAISANGPTKVLPGTVTIFNRYLREGGASAAAVEDDSYEGRELNYGRPPAGSLEQLAQFTVGALPDQLTFSEDCKTILTANEGEPETYTPASLANDPEGSVSVISLFFCDGVDKAYGLSTDDSPPAAGTAGGIDTEAHRRGKKHTTSYKAGHNKGGGYGEQHHTYHPREEPSHTHSPHKEPSQAYPPEKRHAYTPPEGPEEPKWVYHADPYPHEEPSYRQHDYDQACIDVRVYGNVRTAGFSAWNGKRSQLLAMGVKLDGINATVSQDLEPECTSFSEDGKIAFVSLQENNAVAVLDVAKAVVTGIYGLGFKNHNASANPLDASDRDGPSINIRNWPVFGMFQPDEIKSYRYQGVNYLVTANEGDARSDWPGLNEESRVGSIKGKLNTTIFPDPNTLAANTNLGRLQVLAINGDPYPPFSDPYGTGKFSKLYSFGARSFSIWKLEVPASNQLSDASFTQVFDSAAQLEVISSIQLTDIWNSELGNVANSSWDQRSDNKGPEPEGVVIGSCDGFPPVGSPDGSYYHAYGPEEYRQPDYSADDNPARRVCLFLGTERLGVVYVYDITNPYQPVFQSVARPPTAGTGGYKLSAPEGLAYSKYSLGAKSFPVVLVAYEASVTDSTLPAGLGVYMVTDA